MNKRNFEQYLRRFHYLCDEVKCNGRFLDCREGTPMAVIMLFVPFHQLPTIDFLFQIPQQHSTLCLPDFYSAQDFILIAPTARWSYSLAAWLT